MFDLTGKTALVTGATGGIGKATAKALHKAGAQVILTGRNKEALNSLATELGDRVRTYPCDLSNKEEITNLVKDIGKIDILVNNAGLTLDSLFIRMKDEDWSKVLDVNLTASFMLSRAIVLGMMKQRHGRIINISSVVGMTGNIGQANYSASKAGLIAMSKCLALEVAQRNITVNSIAPGFIETAMTDKLPEETKKAILEKIPMHKIGTPQDIANVAVFLASEEASYITGQTIHINGGMAMF